MMTWNKFLEEESNKEYYIKLMDFVENERVDHDIYPPKELVLKAFEGDYDAVKVVILGQDPYHQKGQAMGLSFSVMPGFPLPKSLINIFKELESDLGIQRSNGDLTDWADQGVFLLNALLTVRDSEPASHKKQGWEMFTDSAISYLSKREKPIIFILWGRWAEGKMSLIADHHICLVSAHPSPLGAYRGFWGSRPFSKANDILVELGETPINWGTK